MKIHGCALLTPDSKSNHERWGHRAGALATFRSTDFSRAVGREQSPTKVGTLNAVVPSLCVSI